MPSHPRLTRGVTISRRQVSEDEIYYLVRDPGTGSFLRMGEVEAAVLRLLDGARSLPEVAETLARAHDFHVGVPIIEGFVASLTQRGLIESRGIDPEAFRQEWLRQERSRKGSMGKLLGGLSFLKLHLLNPQRLFQWLDKWLGFLFTPGFVIFSLCLMAAAAVPAALRHEEILKSMAEFYRAGTSSVGSFAAHAAVVYVVFLIVVTVHEASHGLTCTHFGGKVTDVGVSVIYLQIFCLYCDITDAYSFEKRSHRLWTTVAGGYSGLVLASMGVFIWCATEPGDLLNDASIMLMMLGGPPLLIFNWNPLLRLDGYYILMDLVEAPNLMDNSFKYLGHVVKSRLLRVPVEPMTVPPRLRKVYLFYGGASLFVVVPLLLYMPLIAYYLVGHLVGDTLAMPIAALVAYRVWKGPAKTIVSSLRYAWLSHRPALTAASRAQEGRTRTALMGVGAVAAVMLALFGPRFAVRARGAGTLEPLERIDVRAFSPGFVPGRPSDIATMPRDGDTVAAGDLLVRLVNPEIEEERRAARLDLQALRLDLSMLQARGEPALVAARRSSEPSAMAREAVADARYDALSLRAPLSGVVLTPRLEDRTEAYLEPGDVWCTVGRTNQLRVRVALTERDIGLIGAGDDAEIKPLHLPGETFRGRVSRMPAGRRSAPSAPGPPAPPIQAGAAPVTAVPNPVMGSLEVEVEVDNSSGMLEPGMSARVRVYGERLTVAGHAARGLRRLFKGKVWW